jgi:hypothetical protein
MADLVLPISSPTTRFLSVFDLRFDSASASASCVYPMNAVDKILSGFSVPFFLFMIWIICRTIQGLHRYRHRHDDDNDNDAGMLAKRTITAVIASRGAADALLDDVEDNNNNDPSLARGQPQQMMCCNGWFRVPSVQLMLLYATLLSYAGIVRASLSLLQCRQSPIDESKSIMFLAGKHIQ